MALRPTGTYTKDLHVARWRPPNIREMLAKRARTDLMGTPPKWRGLIPGDRRYKAKKKPVAKRGPVVKKTPDPYPRHMTRRKAW